MHFAQARIRQVSEDKSEPTLKKLVRLSGRARRMFHSSASLCVIDRARDTGLGSCDLQYRQCRQRTTLFRGNVAINGSIPDGFDYRRVSIHDGDEVHTRSLRTSTNHRSQQRKERDGE